MVEKFFKCSKMLFHKSKQEKQSKNLVNVKQYLKLLIMIRILKGTLESRRERIKYMIIKVFIFNLII